MSIKVIKNFNGGLSTTLDPVNIRDDEFSQLNNMFCWRGSLRPKSGNKTAGVLTTTISSDVFTTLDSSGNGSFESLAGQPETAYISSESLLLSDGVNSYLQSSTLDGTLSSSGTATGTINYATGAITISGGAPNQPVSGTIYICLGLPVMGISNWLSGINTIAVLWDTNRAYKLDSYISGKFITNSSYASSGSLCTWNGTDYNLFSSTNFAGSLWCTNTVVGMQVKLITNISLGATTTITINNHGLNVDDIIWLNEVSGTSELNGVTATVLSTPTNNTFTINVDSTGYAPYTSGGIAQYLTSNAAYPTFDGIRYFYDNKWVNYAPPINEFVEGGDPVEYVCGCRCMLTFKGRLCLFGVYVATAENAALGSYTYYPSSMFYSSLYGINFGSPYYTTLNPINVVNKGAFYAFPSGVYGGNIDFGTNQEILGAIDWKLDYVFITFYDYKLRLFSTSSPVFPFGYTRISSQYGGTNYTSQVSLDEAVLDLSIGGFVASTATNVRRFDDSILSLYLSVSSLNNGLSRVISYNEASLECVIFTFPSFGNSGNGNKFPDKSLLYNYRNDTWALLDTSFTCYGSLPVGSGFLYDESIYTYTKTWSHYQEPFNFQGIGAGATYRAAGNQCGFILELGDDEGFQNGESLPIAAINGNVFTIYNHNLDENKFIHIIDCIGVTGVNGFTYQVIDVVDTNNVVLDIQGNEGTYLGLGKAAIVDNFIVETKAFNDGISFASGICIGNAWMQIKMTGSSGADFVVGAYPDTSTNTSSFGSEQTGYVPIYVPVTLSAPDTEDGYNNDQQSQSYSWKQVVVNCTGSSVSLVFTRLPEQISNKEAIPTPININAIVLKMTPTSRLVN